MLSLIIAVSLHASIPEPVRAQVKWLEATLDDADAAANQAIFPEGEMFTWEFFGLALLNIAEVSHEQDDVNRAARQVRAMLPKIDQLLGHQPFAPMAKWPLRGGVCWFGGQNILRARMIALLGAAAFDSEVRRFHDDSATLARAFAASRTGILEAYPGLAWPVDSLFALESLQIHDRLYGTAYFAPAYEKYSRSVDAATGKSGLPASMVHPDGRPRDIPRGCALSWSLAVLPRLDAVRAAKMWAAYKRDFFSCTLMPCLVREYPRGVDRAGDVDSGPILDGYGMAATGFALAAARANADSSTAMKLEVTGELLGAATTDARGKRYLGGAMPMFDVLSLFVRTVPEPTTLAAVHER
jgi:hypothetical protein